MRVAMIGTGYVGLVSGACFADFGHQSSCVDKEADSEPGLDDLVATNVKAARLSFKRSAPT